MLKKTITLALSILLLLSVVTGCGKTGSGETGKTDGIRNDLVTVLPSDFTTLDPQKLPSISEINFCTNIFDTLVSLDEQTHEIKPLLADSWIMAEDGLSYTFHLKKGVKFHNGDELKASDVVYSAKRFMDQEWMKPFSFMLADAKALDDHTVKLDLKYPYGPFLSEMCYLMVASEKYMDQQGDAAAQNPMGSGAYKFVKWDVGQQIQLEANPDYFMGAPSIQNLTFKIISDSNTAYVALETGEADLSFNCSALDFEQAKSNQKFGTDAVTGTSCYFVNYNTERLDKAIRQALCYAVDKEAMNTLVNEGAGVVTNLPLTSGQEGYTTDIQTYEFNPEKARQLLKEAGASGLAADFFYGESTMNAKMGQALQSMYNDVGVTLKLKPVENGTWWQMFGEGDYDISRGGYPMEVANTDAPYFDMYHKDGTFNVSRVNDEKLNKMLEAARVETDADKRNGMYVEINKYVAEQAFSLPLYFSNSTIVYNANLKGVKALADQRYRYGDYSW